VPGQTKDTRALLAENERLRAQVASFEAEKLSLAERTHAIELVLAENERLRDLLSSAQAAKTRLERGQSRVVEKLAEVEAQFSGLAHLYVASRCLHGSLRRRDVLEAVQEIVNNLIGSQEAALFELREEGEALSLAACFGIDPGPYRRVRLGEGWIGRCAETGETQIGGARRAERALERERDLTACVPMKMQGRVVGALALFRLLPQKSAGLTALDHDLLELLAAQAAAALCGARERQPDADMVRR
jgi:GAF domain-containing protein